MSVLGTVELIFPIVDLVVDRMILLSWNVGLDHPVTHLVHALLLLCVVSGVLALVRGVKHLGTSVDVGQAMAG